MAAWDALAIEAGVPLAKALGGAIRPDQPRVLLNRGQALRNLGRTEEAIDALQASARAEPANPEPFKVLAHLFYALRRPDEAAACAARAPSLAAPRAHF